MTTDALPLLIVVTGPTAAGKTKLAVELAQHYSSQIISCDSRQFYQELKIGVARPSAKELAAVPHHMVGFLPVTDPYNAFRYESDVLELTQRLFAESRNVFLVGGSGLYIHAVTHGIDHLPDPDPELRRELKEELNRKGIGALQEKLRRLDPDYFRMVDQGNPKRLLRALEVCITTGTSYSSLRIGQPSPRPFNTVKVGITMEREELYGRINRRVDQMMEDGLLDEAVSLLPFRDLNALNTVGYKELFAYFDGKVSLEKAVANIKTNTRRYAKRQLTWLRKDPEIRWFRPEETVQIRGLINAELKIKN